MGHEIICDYKFGSSGSLLWPKAQNKSFPSVGLCFLMCKMWWLNKTIPEVPFSSDALPLHPAWANSLVIL